MFQLVIAVIAIALIASLSIAAIFYGGSAFNKGSMSTNVTTLVNGGQQIANAVGLYRTHESEASVTNIIDLVPAYLTQNPTLPNVVTKGDVWIVTRSPLNVAIASVKLTESTALATCKVVATQGQQTEPANLAALTSEVPGRYGCYRNGTTYYFGYKL